MRRSGAPTPDPPAPATGRAAAHASTRMQSPSLGELRADRIRERAPQRPLQPLGDQRAERTEAGAVKPLRLLADRRRWVRCSDSGRGHESRGARACRRSCRGGEEGRSGEGASRCARDGTRACRPWRCHWRSCACAAATHTSGGRSPGLAVLRNGDAGAGRAGGRVVALAKRRDVGERIPDHVQHRRLLGRQWVYRRSEWLFRHKHAERQRGQAGAQLIRALRGAAAQHDAARRLAIMHAQHRLQCTIGIPVLVPPPCLRSRGWKRWLCTRKEGSRLG
mmetsp:Transcript_9706/g.30555  ORF Transcript_9706/g.30555 Transcript_9706/m.30555 type:complete len:278 (-) Transcript_9706:25-858(-)